MTFESLTSFGAGGLIAAMTSSKREFHALFVRNREIELSWFWIVNAWLMSFVSFEFLYSPSIDDSVIFSTTTCAP